MSANQFEKVVAVQGEVVHEMLFFHHGGEILNVGSIKADAIFKGDGAADLAAEIARRWNAALKLEAMMEKVLRAAAAHRDFPNDTVRWEAFQQARALLREIREGK